MAEKRKDWVKKLKADPDHEKKGFPTKEPEKKPTRKSPLYDRKD